VIVVDPGQRAVSAGELGHSFQLRVLDPYVLPPAWKAQEVGEVVLGAVLPARAPDALEGASQPQEARSRTFTKPMWNAIDRYGESKGRAGVIEAEEGDHPVHVDEQKRNLSLHLARGR
jgi:hypothetical protein